MYQVYAIINNINGSMYIGCTEVELKIRWQRHLAQVNKKSYALYNAIKKYGKDNFNIKMIETYSSKEDMLRGEISWIKYYNTYKSPYGYNETPGGEGGNTNGGKIFSNNWRVNISKARSGKEQFSRRKFNDKEEKEICQLYLKEEMSTYALGNKFNCSKTTVTDILKRNLIPIRSSNYNGHTRRNIFSEEQELEICKLYENGDVSKIELSKKFNCSKTTIRKILLRHNKKL